MSDFSVAHKKVMRTEGEYANFPSDRGGETYKGVARNCHPKWGGWKYIDGAKSGMLKQPAYGTGEYFNWVKFLNRQLAGITALQQLVDSFYRANFWKDLSQINDQTLATWVYDKDVNTGSMGTRWLQAALGVVVDGCVGPKTIEAANAADAFVVLERMKTCAVDYYLTLAQKPCQKAFWRSWIERVGLSPEKLLQANSAARNLGIFT